MKATLQSLLEAAERGEDVAIITHHPCPDGFASAYCAWTRLGDKARYVAYDHDNPPSPETCRGAWVAMCDCCFKRPAMMQAVAFAKALVVLDHHKSSHIDCEGIDECDFDMERSGCGMAWDFFHPGVPRPLLIDCVQDRDLHLYLRPETGAFCSKLDSLPMDFPSWDLAAQLSGPALARFMREGAEMLLQFEAQAQAIARTATSCDFFGRRTYLLNAPYRFASRCGAILCDKVGCELALIWSSADLKTARISLRSKPGTCDVSTIASSLGGGGHATSSGASLPLNRLTELAKQSRWDKQS